MQMRFAWCLLVALAMACASGNALAQRNNLAAMGCGDFSGGGYGPFDYRTDKHKLGVVESFHFDSGVESLTRGKSTSVIGGDIAYTLHAFPNHHRALMAMMNLGFREKRPQVGGAKYSVECYMARAEAFRPNDPMVQVIYGLYLMRAGRPGDAVKKLEGARAQGENDANVHYNLGLAYVQLRQYDKALESAHRAYGLGFPLPGLRNQLQRAGRWRDLPAAQPEGVSPHEPD